MAVHYFLVWPILLLTLVAVEALQYGRMGSETTLVPQIRGAPDAIIWKQTFRKVVEFDGSEESVQDTFRDRVVLDWHTASLTIKDLRLADSGPYELEATINNKKYYSQHEVAVIEKVATPTITCIINGTVSGVGESDAPRTHAVLRCSAEGPPSLITYAWTPLDGVATKGAWLTVALAGDRDDTVYTCRASNPVSQEMGTFVAKDCYPDSFPAGGIIAIVVCLLVVISVGCVLGYLKWSKAHPNSDGIEDVESQPLKRSNGSGNSKAYGNRATLPSAQRLLPPTGEDTHSGGGGDSTRVSVHSSESRLPDPQQPSDLESKLSAGDSAVGVLVEPGRGSESDLTAPQPMDPRDGHLGSDLVGRLGSEEGGHLGSDEGGHLGSEEGSQAADADLYGSDPEALPAAVVPREEEGTFCTPRGSRGSLHGDKEEEVEAVIHTPLGSVGSLHEAEQEDIEEKVEAVGPAPFSLLGSSSSSGEKKAEEEEKEEKAAVAEEEEEKMDTGVGPADEDGGERLVAAGEPPVNVVTQPSEMKEAVAGAPHGAEVLQEEGEVGEDDGEEEGQGVSSPEQASPPDSHSDLGAEAGERGTDGREEDTEETSRTPEIKQDEAEDGTEKVVPPTEQEVMRRREEESDVPGTSGDGPQGTKDDEGNDKGVASSPASKPESHQDSEAAVEEGDTDRSTEGETINQQGNAGDGAGQVTPTVEPAAETPERKREDESSHDDSEGQEEGEEEEESEDGGGASPPASRPEPHRDSEAVAGEGNTDGSSEEETMHHQGNAGDGAGQMAPPAEPAVKTPEGEGEDVPQTSPHDAEQPEEGEGEEEDGKDGGGARPTASRPETDVYSEAITDTSMVDKKLDVESPEGKEEEDNVPQTVHDNPLVQEAEGLKEGGKTSLAEVESGPEPGPDPDRQPGGSGAGRGGTQGSGGQHEGRKEGTRDGRLPANPVEDGDCRDGNKDAENEDGTE